MGKEQDKYLDIHRVSNTIRCEELYIIFLWNTQMLWLWFAGNTEVMHIPRIPQRVGLSCRTSLASIKLYQVIIYKLYMQQILKWKPFVV